MSASVFSPTSRSSWRSHQLGGGGGQLFDPSRSYPYAPSAGGFSALDASTFSIQPPQQVIPNNAHHLLRRVFVRQGGAVTREQVERGLSELGRTGDGTGVAFLSLTLKVRSLQ